ncbi:hypothetical protein J6590_069616 [Homalodisca vitripennis]|nr:hypothetical protein J6590_069616 [Homalodisca vitripennis]
MLQVREKTGLEIRESGLKSGNFDIDKQWLLEAHHYFPSRVKSNAWNSHGENSRHVKQALGNSVGWEWRTHNTLGVGNTTPRNVREQNASFRGANESARST